jgi:hypothetical protein
MIYLYILFIVMRTIFAYKVDFWYSMEGLAARTATPLGFIKAPHLYFLWKHILFFLVVLFSLISPPLWKTDLLIFALLLYFPGMMGARAAFRVQRQRFKELSEMATDEFGKQHWGKMASLNYWQMKDEVKKHWDDKVKYGI